MKKEIFDSYKPQRIFLVQGTSATADTLVAEMDTSYAVVHALNVPRFTVKHAATIASFATEGDGTERVCIGYFALFSPDAAQALLKSLEEPDEMTTVIFVTPYPYIVPITIRSRVTLLQTERASSSAVKRSKIEAMEYVKTELSGESEDDAAIRRANAINFLDELENEFKQYPQKIHIIYEAKRMLFRANMPTKFVMEFVVTALY